MDSLPSWAICAALVIALLASLAGGLRLHRTLKAADDGGPGVGALVGASLGLLSLLIGFTLALSLNRYEARRDLVIREAAAITTTWQRDQLLAEPYRGRLDGLLRAYVRERRDLASAGTRAAALDASDARTEALQQAIWRETVGALRAPDAGPLTPPVLQSTGVMFDLPAARRAELDAQVPHPVLWTVAIVAVVSAGLTGYGLAAGGRAHWLASGAFFVAVALSLTLIFELDEPRSGLIRVPQAPLDRAAHAILSAPPVGP